MESKETRSTDNIQPEIAPTPEVIQLAAVLATPDHPADLVRFIANAFGVSRQTVHKHVRRLVDGGDLIAHGKTRARRYTLRDLTQERRELDVTPKLEEDRVWREYILPKLEGVPENIEQICEYGFTEMVNNVVDHSESEKLTIGMTMNMRDIRMFVRDFGVGIFHKIQEELQLHDPRHALLELSKGKLTTDPKRHSGEGIYFTSRAFNEFSISSGELYFQRSLDDNSQWLIETESREHFHGTMMFMTIMRWSPRTLREVFSVASSEDEELRFKQTHVPITLVRYGDEQLVSRSQAKRLLARFDRFSEILLDFDGVKWIGQGFADEIFRVYRNSHPDVRIMATRATPEIHEMIQRVSEVES